MTERSTALVAGASAGIGAEVSRRLAAAGYELVLTGRNVDRLGQVAEETGGVPVRMDLADPADVARACARVADLAASPVDLLVNAAGVFDLMPVADTSPESFGRHLDVNLRGPFLLIRHFLPGMLDRGRGLLVNVGSVSGRRAMPDNGAYSASKYGLRGLHEVLLEEIRGTGVRACLLEPGAVDTSMWDTLDPDGRPDVPNRDRMLRASDVADAVLYVAALPARVSVPLLQIEPS